MRYIAYIIFPFLFISCKKEVLPELPPNNSPVFSIEGNIDGQQVTVSAGDNGYFMHSENFLLRGVAQWKGTLANNQSSFELILSDGIVDVPNSTYDISTSNYLSFTEIPTTPLLTLSKNQFSNSEYIQSISWVVNGELYSSPDSLTIYEPGKYSICATITFYNQTQATTCNELILGYDRNAKGALKFILGQNDNLIAFFDTPEYEIDHVEWYYNDSLISANKVNLSTQMNTNTCHLRGVVHYANGVVRSRAVHIDKLSQEHYIQDLTSFEDQTSTSWDFKLRMHINHNGQHYRSIESTTLATQLEIISISEFGYNSNGDKVMLVRGHITAPFYHEESETIVNTDLTISFALPYK